MMLRAFRCTTVLFLAFPMVWFRVCEIDRIITAKILILCAKKQYTESQFDHLKHRLVDLIIFLGEVMLCVTSLMYSTMVMPYF